MGLFKKLLGGGMQDPVEGSAKVVACNDHSGRGHLEICKMNLVVAADGVEPTAVEHSQLVRRDRWPEPEMTLPVTVDQADPSNFSIRWDEVPTVADRGRLEAEAAAAEMRGESPGA